MSFYKYTKKRPILDLKCKTREQLTDNDRPTSLLHYSVNYDCKKYLYYRTGSDKKT